MGRRELVNGLLRGDAHHQRRKAVVVIRWLTGRRLSKSNWVDQLQLNSGGFYHSLRCESLTTFVGF